MNGAEIVLDEMPYGNFVEIEGEAERIKQLVAKLELGAHDDTRAVIPHCLNEYARSSG